MSELTENQRAWLDALRSGEYQQGQNVLRRGDQFCCLGVACDIAVKAGLKVEITPAGLTPDGYEYDGQEGALPPSVQHWLGLRSWTGRPDRESLSSCTSMNDNYRWSFAQIADVIEQNAEAYFGPAVNEE